MSFEYKGYKIERMDENNIGLFQWKSVKRVVKETKEEIRLDTWVFQGYYLTLFGAARALIDRLAEDAEEIGDLKEIVSEWSFIQKELGK